MALGALESTTVRMPAPGHWRHRSNLICYINVTGFAAIMFVLVVVFMMLRVDDMDSHSRGSVDIPPVDHPRFMSAADREDAMTVAVLRDGRIFFGSNPVTSAQLPAVIREGVRRGSEPKIYLRVDRRVWYGSVKQVIDAIHASGIEKIGILVEQRKTPSPAP